MYPTQAPVQGLQPPLPIREVGGLGRVIFWRGLGVPGHKVFKTSQARLSFASAGTVLLTLSSPYPQTSKNKCSIVTPTNK
jgi:hypothetical protein